MDHVVSKLGDPATLERLRGILAERNDLAVPRSLFGKGAGPPGKRVAVRARPLGHKDMLVEWGSSRVPLRVEDLLRALPEDFVVSELIAELKSREVRWWCARCPRHSGHVGSPLQQRRLLPSWPRYCPG